MANNNAQDTILFIPDISGFTRFVEETAIEHSRHIIEELLQIIVKHNVNDFKIAEIEADAIFFYTYQKPTWKNFWHQLAATFEAFHHHLKKYEVLRICQCGACQTANDLTLKFILHTGQTIPIQSLKKIKPHGKAVIQAHSLLKNHIPAREYVLMTNEFFKPYGHQIKSADHDLQPYLIAAEQASKNGITAFSLHHLHRNIPPVINTTVPQLSTAPCRFEIIIPAPHEHVESSLLDPYYKSRWNKLVTKVHVNDPTNKIESEHICLINQTPVKIKTVTHPNIADAWVFGEHMQDVMWAKEVTMYFIAKPINENSTLLSFELHWMPKSWLFKAYGSVMQWALCRYFQFALARFKKEISIPAELQPKTLVA